MATKRRGLLSQNATQKTMPAPTAGWNARDALPNMAPNDAVILENFVPGSTAVSMRGGTLTRTTGLPTRVRSLMPYNKPGVAAKMFAGSGTAIYDVSGAGPVGAPVVSSLTSDDWLSTNFGTPGGNFLPIANGSDNPRIYDGATWATMTIAAPTDYPTTLTKSKLMAPFVFGQRLWFIEKGSLRVWYLPLLSIQAPGGVITSDPTAPDVCALCVDFASELSMGGQLVVMADWTRDGGQGADDFAVLITDRGQVLVYGGTDPNDSTSFNLVGKFRIPPPIGNRCVLGAGADLAVLTQTAVLPLSDVLALTVSQDNQVAITDRIRGAFQAAYAATGDVAGWEMAEYPKGALLIVNVPQSGGPALQFVMNVTTQAWCNFRGLDAICFGLLDDMLLFGTSTGTVVQYDAGSQDDGSAISAIALPAFSSFGSPAKKRFLLAKPLYSGVVGYRPAIRLAADYDTTSSALPQGPVPAGGTPWGSPWNSPWSPKKGQSNEWQGIEGECEVASILMNVVSNSAFEFNQMGIQFEAGGAF